MTKLTNISTRAPKKLDKENAKKETAAFTQKIKELQKILYTQSKYSILIVLQGLDASGKDGLVSEVFSGTNPLGCKVKAFKKPTEEELSHDFLWRVHHHAPAKGMMQIFNRSHYEDVLVPRVEKWTDMKIIKKRFEHINHFEDLLKDNNTVVLKFYLHISQEEQKKRLEERKTNPKKFWKHSDEDWETSKKWAAYMEAYEDIFKHCSPIPWTIVPSDQNWYKEYLVAKKIKEALEGLDLKYPER